MAVIGYSLRMILKALSLLSQFLKELLANLTDLHRQVLSNEITVA